MCYPSDIVACLMCTHPHAQVQGREHAPEMPNWYRRRLENRAQIAAREKHKLEQAKKDALVCPPELTLDFSPQELDEIRDMFMEARARCPPSRARCRHNQHTHAARLVL